jgi:predicted enzyme related to lactoylglutathione lyase
VKRVTGALTAWYRAYGRFAWVMDPEGNKIELWEPAEGH